MGGTRGMSFGLELGLAVGALIFAACGGGDAGSGDPTATATATMSSTTGVSVGTTEQGSTAEPTTDDPPTTGMSASGTTADVATTTGDMPPMPFCGDGVVDPGETCDAGDANADDAACTSQCQTAACGDGLVHAGVEDCDDGNADDADACLSTCKAAGCGDGVVGPGEACDDGNQVDDDDCTNKCAPPNCGDGVLQQAQGEECDDGNQVDTDACLATCVAAKCGDGVTQAGVEECDDANLDETDMCTASCKLPTCMDGVKNGPESDVDCGGACMKCGLGGACQVNADCGAGLCIANTCAVAKSCKQIKEANPAAKTGPGQIDPDGAGPIAPFNVHCEMDTDTCGYTWLRIDDPALLNDQNAYAAKCSALGMEVLVTRTKAHAQAFFDWNLSQQANLLNIFPKNNGAQSINNWQGICQGAPCSFWMTDTANGDVGCTNFEPNGDNNVSFRIYRRSAGCGLQGNWNDANNTVAIQGWVVCSTNDC